MKIKVSQDQLDKTVQESREAKEKSISNMNREKFPVCFSKLIITKVEHTSFTYNDKKTGEEKEVQKLIVHFNTGLKNSQDKYFDFRLDFPFFVFNDKNTGEPKCISFEQTYTFIADAFGKNIKFKNPEAEIKEIVETLNKAFEYYAKNETPFYGIVVHKEAIYKDRLIYSPEIYLSSVTTVSGKIKEMEELDKNMSNKVWKLNEAEKKKQLAKIKNQKSSIPKQDQEDGIPSGVDSYSPDLDNMSEQEDDLPF